MVGLQVSFDAGDPRALARFWAVALDYVEQPPPEGFASWDAFADQAGIPPERRGDIAAIVDPHGVGPRLLFLRVPEPKSAKNRLHLDLAAGGGEHDRSRVAAHVERLVAAGGTVVAERGNALGEHWVVMADPEGNELCVQ